MADDQRFDRVEKNLDKLGDKIDELTKVVTAMARIEERMVTLFKRMDRYDEAHSDLDERLTEIEKTSSKRGVVYHLIDKGFWLIIGAGLTYIAKVSGG
jgi:hemerythrin superfamily protein